MKPSLPQIAENLQWAFESSGALTKSYAREVMLWVAKGQLGDDMTGPLTKSVVAMLDNIEIGGQSRRVRAGRTGRLTEGSAPRPQEIG